MLITSLSIACSKQPSASWRTCSMLLQLSRQPALDRRCMTHTSAAWCKSTAHLELLNIQLNDSTIHTLLNRTGRTDTEQHGPHGAGFSACPPTVLSQHSERAADEGAMTTPCEASPSQRKAGVTAPYMPCLAAQAEVTQDSLLGIVCPGDNSQQPMPCLVAQAEVTQNGLLGVVRPGGNSQQPMGAGGAHRCACSGSPTSVMSPSGPTMQRVDVTTFSRSGSSGGLVT